MWTTLISAEELAHVIDRCVVVDCSHDLMDAAAGRRMHEAAHIPGAHFLSLDEPALSGPKTGRNGRHPLPDPAVLRERLEALGVSDDTQLVAYDAQAGMFAGRLWWLARWLGHERVAILDGGLQAWQQARWPVNTEPATPRTRGTLSARPSLVRTVDADDVAAGLAGGALVLDARAAARYEGREEAIDPVAGHIPGAVNRPFQQNLRPDGRFKPAPALREEYLALLAGRAPDTVIQQCGSGVSAVHNLVAMEMAGLSGSALYPGSWSEWCADPARPVATGPTP